MVGETVKAIRQAVLDHKVVFLRNQGHLDEEAQDEVTRLFGKPIGHPTLSQVVDRNRYRELTKQAGARSNWHSDITFVADYPAFGLLRAIDIPPAGGETIWANTASAYESLPEVLQRIADQLWVRHSNEYDWDERVVDEDREAAWYRFRTEFFASSVFVTEHPLVRVHPETGERSLVLGNFASRGFVGLDGPDSRAFFEIFHRHITSVENTVRWRWTSGDLAIYDNRSTEHYVSQDYGTYPRRMYRSTVAGEVPVSVDGRQSIVRKGADHPWYAPTRDDFYQSPFTTSQPALK
jgi:taurine dioxygenase